MHCQLRPDTNFGSISEKINSIIGNYINNTGVQHLEKYVKSEAEDGIPPEKKFQDLLYLKYRRSLCEPGEAVGLLAAQVNEVNRK